jgi:hypothetical protein
MSGMLLLYCAIFFLSQSALSQIDYSCLHKYSWNRYIHGSYNQYFESTTDLESSYYVGSSSAWRIQAYGIPSYSTDIDQSDIDQLNSRPQASTDFRSNGKVRIHNTVAEIVVMVMTYHRYVL